MVVLDHDSFPHLVDLIIEHADHCALALLRRTCRRYRAVIERKVEHVAVSPIACPAGESSRVIVSPQRYDMEGDILSSSRSKHNNVAVALSVSVRLHSTKHVHLSVSHPNLPHLGSLVFNSGQQCDLESASDSDDSCSTMADSPLKGSSDLALEFLRCATVLDVKGTLGTKAVAALVRATPRAHTLRVLGGEWHHSPTGWGVRRLISFADSNIVDAHADIETVIVGLKLHQRYLHPRHFPYSSPCTPAFPSRPTDSMTETDHRKSKQHDTKRQSEKPTRVHQQQQQVHFLFPQKDTHGYDLAAPPPSHATAREISFTQRAIHDVLVYAVQGLARGQPHFLVGLTEYHPAWLGMSGRPGRETIEKRFSEYVYHILSGPGSRPFRCRMSSNLHGDSEWDVDADSDSEARQIANAILFPSREEHRDAHPDYLLHELPEPGEDEDEEDESPPPPPSTPQPSSTARVCPLAAAQSS